VVNGIKSLKEAKIKVEDAYVIVNRMEGANEALKEEGVTLHSIVNVIQITKSLHEQNLVDDNILQKIKEQIGTN
jgi:orotate phosphoribosyltransferase